jgi:hypothetical protein
MLICGDSAADEYVAGMLHILGEGCAYGAERDLCEWMGWPPEQLESRLQEGWIEHNLGHVESGEEARPQSSVLLEQPYGLAGTAFIFRLFSPKPKAEPPKRPAGPQLGPQLVRKTGELISSHE